MKRKIERKPKEVDGVTFVENVERRHWDIEQFQKRELELLEREETSKRKKKQLIVRENLKPRVEKPDLESRVGKYTVITNNTPLSQRGGYWCDVCECNLKDSLTYLDHINGKKHQRHLGMSMRLERSSIAQVRERLKLHKELKEQNKTLSTIDTNTDIVERLEEAKNEEEQEKLLRIKNKASKKMKEEKEKERNNENEMDPEMAEMGFDFTSFGSSSK